MPRKQSKPKQTRLSFNPAPSASAQTTSHDATNTSQRSNSPQKQKSREANLRYGHPSLGTLSRRKVQVGSGREEGREHKQKNKNKQKEQQQLPTRSVGDRSTGRKKGGSLFGSRKSRNVPVSDDEDDEVEVVEPVKSKQEETVIDLESSDSEPKVVNKKRKRSASSDEEESERKQTDESDAEEVVSGPRRKLRRGGASKPPVVAVDEDEDDDDEEDEPVVATPSRRKRIAPSDENPETPKRDSDQAKLDIEADLEDLQDSGSLHVDRTDDHGKWIANFSLVVKDTRTRGHLANSARSKRQEQLERLRRRRAGDKTEDPTDSEAEPGEESEADSGSEDEDENENENGGGLLGPFTTATLQAQLTGDQENSDVESIPASNEDLDRYDEDFVDEDDNDPLGIPTGLEDMPIEFTRHAYKQTKEYFRDAIEWMVQNKLNPEFPRSAALYKVAFSKVEDQVKGRTGSQLISSVWNAGFHRALLARPHIEVTTFPLSSEHPCDACNRSKHPASFDVKLYGKAYSLDTLEDIKDEDDEGDEDETDRDGNILPNESTRFFLGRYVPPYPFFFVYGVNQ